MTCKGKTTNFVWFVEPSHSKSVCPSGEHDQHLQTAKWLLKGSHMPSFGLKMQWSKSISKVFRLWRSVIARPSLQPQQLSSTRESYAVPYIVFKGSPASKLTYMHTSHAAFCDSFAELTRGCWTWNLGMPHSWKFKLEVWPRLKNLVIFNSSTYRPTHTHSFTTSAMFEQVWNAFVSVRNSIYQAATYSGAQQDQHNVESLSSSGIVALLLEVRICKGFCGAASHKPH